MPGLGPFAPEENVNLILMAADSAVVAASSPVSTSTGPSLFGVPVSFILFALTLLGVAVFHHHTLKVALVGLGVITLYKLLFTGFSGISGLGGLALHLGHEWVVLANLFGLLVGFALLADHFEKSHIPGLLPAVLPDDWRGPAVLLVLVFVLSSFLDNIAAAIIGGTVAASVFRGRVHIGYLAAIVAASNGGGSGSVVGDTTTTMMWIEGISPWEVLSAYLPAVVALLVFTIPAALLQQRHSPILCDSPADLHIDWSRLAIVGLMLLSAIAVNVTVNTQFREVSDSFPFIAAAVWVVVLATAPWRKPDWALVPGAVKGSVFLLSLVLCASMMPVESLPSPSWQSTIGLGFVSAVFDNIPLTKLALEQSGYDWGLLAYAVGFGGSMMWFGSSAGVALSNQFPEARSVIAWLRHGWFVIIGYVAGAAVYVALIGFRPGTVL